MADQSAIVRFFSASADYSKVKLTRACAAFSIFLIVVAFSGCICLGPLNYPKHWNNASFDPAADNTINITAMALGETPIRIGNSTSGKIDIAVFYYIPAKFDHQVFGDNLTITAEAMYDSDWTQGVGADIYVYLPESGNYTVNIYNSAAENYSPVRNNSQTTVSYEGNITVWTNDENHRPPPPW